MRAGNKGRSLRPRTSPSRNSAVPPESDLATSEQEEAEAPLAAPADPETLQALRGAQATAPSPEVVAPAKITPAEVLAAGEAFSGEDEEEEDEEDEAPSAKVEAPVVAKTAEPAPVVVVAKKVDPAPVVVVAKNAEELKKVEAVAPVRKLEEPKKAEPQAQVKKSEAPQAQAKKGEPIKGAVAKKIDENATTLRAERTPTVDEDLRSGNKKKGGKSDAPRTDAKRPANDEVDDSSISAEFFRREGDSLPPMVDAHGDHEDHDDAGVHVLSAETIARRARLRRVVAGVVAFAAVITLAVVGKTLAAGKQPATSVPMKPTVTQEGKVDSKPEEKVAPPPEKTAAPPPVAALSASAAVAKVDDPKADVKPVEEPKPAEEPKKPEPTGGDAKALTKEAESFLNRGNRKDAMAKAREAIAADPTQALPYLLLGSALQDSGKWKDGIEAYSECVRNATKGPVSDCRQMGGHK